MADGMSDADRIRNKRLAKLAGGSLFSTPSGSAAPSNDDSNTSPQSTPSASDQQNSVASPKEQVPQQPQNGQAKTESPKPKINISRKDADQNPFSKLKEQSSSQSPSSHRSALAESGKPRSSSRSRARQAAAIKSPEQFEDETISHVFRVSLDSGKTKDPHGNSIKFLSGVHADLEQQSQPLRFTCDSLSDIITEAASDLGKTHPFVFVLSSWKRVSKVWRQHRSANPDDPRLSTIKEIRRMTMSYCVFSLTMPEMFGVEESHGNVLAQHLLEPPESERGIDHDFVTEAVARFEEDESTKTLLVEAMEQLSLSLSTKSMMDDYRPYVNALKSFMQHPALATALTESSRFAPADVEPQDIEKKSLLGPFFAISPTQGEVAVNYFSSPKTRDRGSIYTSQNALRMTLKTHQDDLFSITDRFIRASKESRERTLDWLALSINKNHKRRAMRPDPRYISSDGYMVNITIVLDQLCEPFMDASFNKIGRIEAEYFRREPRIKIDDETKINADQATADAFYAKKADGQNNFISEVFFLTVAAHHYGTESANTSLSRLRKDLKHMDQQLERFEAEREKYLNQPFALQRFDEAFKKYKDQAERGHCVYYALEGILLDEGSQSRSMSFMRYVIVWMMRLVSGVDFPKQNLSLPLPAEQPEVFSCLPEYFLEDVVDHFKFITGHMPHVISPTQCDELVMICITFLRSSEYIKNPYLKSGLITILFYGVMPTRTNSKGVLGDILNALPFALKHLLHSMMKFYIECESTGAHTQFYDKFNIRYEIFQVVKCIWGNVVYRDHLATEARVNSDFFVRFVNMLLNDVTFVLDESFSAFNKISSLQRELADAAFAALPDAEKQEKQEALEEAQGKAKSYMQLTNESVATLKLFTDALAAAFTSPEIVQRLADMLDYNLESLVGPKQSALRVDNPGQYGFTPKALLSDIVHVYLNLAAKPAFHTAIARDGRSYKQANFDAAAEILERHALASAGELARWRRLGEAVAAAKAEDDAEEEDLEDVPDEFMDPLLSTVMTDPVILPVSKAVMDRSTIRQHLLSDPHDPFNRAPLKIDDVVEATELKGRIEAFRTEKRAKRLAAKEGAADEVMDTS